MKVKEALEKYRVEEVRMRTLQLDKERLKYSNDIDRVKAIEKEYYELENKHKKINEALYILKKREMEVIKCLYIEGKTRYDNLIEVGMKINMSRSNIAKLRKKALNELQDFLNGNL